jgi:hypothetical protein
LVTAKPFSLAEIRWHRQMDTMRESSLPSGTAGVPRPRLATASVKEGVQTPASLAIGAVTACGHMLADCLFPEVQL